MLKARGDRGCCDRCAGATGMADAARVARRRLFKDAVFGLTPDLAPEPGPLGRDGEGPGGAGPARAGPASRTRPSCPGR